MIWLPPLLFGLGCVLVVRRTRGDRLRRGVALSLAALWASCNLLWLAGALHLVPVADFVVGLLALLAWVERPSRWALQMVMLSYLRLGVHAGYELADAQFVVLYIQALNALFALQLVVVSMPGGVNGIGHLCRVLRPRHRDRAGVAALGKEQGRWS